MPRERENRIKKRKMERKDERQRERKARHGKIKQGGRVILEGFKNFIAICYTSKNA